MYAKRYKFNNKFYTFLRRMIFHLITDFVYNPEYSDTQIDMRDQISLQNLLINKKKN